MLNHTNLATDFAANLVSVLGNTTVDGPVWSMSSDQLNVNVLRLSTGAGIPRHTNNEVDVVFVVFEGRGQLMVNDQVHELMQGQIILVPQGATRMLQCTEGPLVYLTCHRRRAGLMPK